MLARAGLGVTNHLDWFLGSIWQILIGVDLGPEKSSDVTNFLTSACVAVNQLAHIQARTLAANATVRREAFLDASVHFLRPGAHFLRSQAIGCVDLLAGRGHKALRTASEEQRTALLFETTVGSSRRPMASATAGPSIPRSRSHAQRKRRGGFAATNPASARRRPNPTPSTTPARRQVDETQLPSPRPVGARLLSFAREWNRLTTDQFVRSVGRKGYRIELDSSPSLSPVPILMHLSRDSEKAQSLRQEIRSLLDKRAIEELNLVSLSPGFYSRIFLVRKKDGDWRPVFDLKSLHPGATQGFRP